MIVNRWKFSSQSTDIFSKIHELFFIFVNFPKKIQELVFQILWTLKKIDELFSNIHELFSMLMNYFQVLWTCLENWWTFYLKQWILMDFWRLWCPIGGELLYGAAGACSRSWRLQRPALGRPTNKQQQQKILVKTLVVSGILNHAAASCTRFANHYSYPIILTTGTACYLSTITAALV